MALAVSDVVANALTDVTTSGATRTVNLPTTGVETGDMMYICMSINKNAADIGDVLTTPTNWTRINTQGLPNTASTPRAYIYRRKVPGGGLGSTVDITSSDTAIGHIAVAFAVQNAEEVPDVVGTWSTGTSTTISCPAVTATNTGGLTIRFGVSDDDDQASQPSMTAHTAINWEEHASPTNGESVYVWVATQPSTSVAAATASIANEQWGGETFVIAEAAAVTITDVETDEEFDDKDTAVTITGTGFEATKGTGKVELASGSDYAAATKILQTTTSWAATSIDFTADLSTLTPGALFLFVTNNTGDRSAGFPVTVHRAIAFVLAASANIAVSGENTTVQLTAPAGKATTDFDAGRIQDDENPADAVNVTLDDYTEMEWCIEATANSEASGIYQFRLVLSDGTVFDTYTVDPRWTIASAGEISQVPVADLNLTGLVPSGVTTENRFSNLALGALAFTGLVPLILVTEIATVPAGDLSFTGQTPNAIVSELSTVPAGDLSFTGLVPTVVVTEGRFSDLPVGDLSFGGAVPTLVATDNRFSNVPVGDLSFTGFVPTAVATSGETSLAPVGDLSLNGLVPSAVTTEHRFSNLSVGDLSFAGLVPTIVTTEGENSQLPVGDLSFAGQIPTLVATDNRFSNLPAGDLSFVGFVMTFATADDAISQAPAGDVSFTGLVPTIVTTEHRVSTIPAGNQILSGLAPTLVATENQFVNLPTGFLILSGLAPLFDRTTDVTPIPVLVLHEPRTVRVSSEARFSAVLGEERSRKIYNEIRTVEIRAEDRVKKPRG